MTKSRDELVRTFRAHVAVFVATMVLIFSVNLLTNLAADIAGDPEAWWSIWALIGWSAALTVHGLLLRAELSAHSSGRHRTSG